MVFRSRKLPSVILLTVLALVLGLSLRHQRENLDQVPNKLREWFHQDHQTPAAVADSSAHVVPSAEVVQKAIIDLEMAPKNKQTGEHPNYLEVFSTTTADKKYFNIKLGSQEAMNPNIIPHPFLNDTWLVVAQKQRSKVPNSIWFAQSVCNANFTKKGILQCIEEPTILPIASTASNKCSGGAAPSFFALNVGPHDGRMFYGPEHPYFIYGSNSKYNCFGLWIQDLRMLVDWGYPVWPNEVFRLATDMQRPGKVGPIEKNYFVFWDDKGKIHVHVDSTPRRVFAELRKDGTVGRDLGAVTAKHDQKCLERYLPKLEPQDESIHQATNSLAITLCKRADPKCRPGPENTFIMTLIQHKTFHDFHSEYEPYIYLFQQSAPFKLYGVTPKPIWIHGRESFTTAESETRKHWQMFYIVSMSWKNHGQKYHGYLDDPLFLSFGIEDDRPAAIDVVAGDLLQGLGSCEGY